MQEASQCRHRRNEPETVDAPSHPRFTLCARIEGFTGRVPS
jgi:hypothetical protein